MANWLAREELILTLFEATLGEAGWERFLSGLCAATGSVVGALNLEHLNSSHGSIFAWHGFEPDAIRKYNQHYARINPYVVRDGGLFAGGFVGSGRTLVSDEFLFQTEFYNDFLKPARVRELMGGPLHLDRHTACILTLGGAPDREAYGTDETDFVRSLMPQTKAALMAWRRMRELRQQCQGLGEAVDSVGFGIVTLQGSGKVMSMNRAARRMVERRDGLTIEKGRLGGPRGSELEPAIAKAVRPCGRQATSHMIPRNKRGSGYGVTVLPLTENSTQQLAGRGAVIVLISDPEADRPGREAALRSLFHLSPAEGRVLRLLMEGMSADEVAGHLELALPTVRTHLRRLFARFGVRRQTDLLTKALLALPMSDEEV